jgi:toxin FitB
VARRARPNVVDLDSTLALAAAKLGVAHKLPLADSVVYATTRAVGGVVWTQDEDFDGLADVQFFPKPGK